MLLKAVILVSTVSVDCHLHFSHFYVLPFLIVLIFSCALPTTQWQFAKILTNIPGSREENDFVALIF